jgi:hypothetical protein
MRILTDPFKCTVKYAMAKMDAQGLFSPPHSFFGNTTVTELLRNGTINVNIDPKYPQAIGISTIRQNTAQLGNFAWEILHNHFDDSPFFTSDFPVANESTIDPNIVNRIIPLAPNLAVRIRPQVPLGKNHPDFSFANFRFNNRKLSRKEIERLNLLIVRCAEDTVFYRDDYPWVRKFVSKNRDYHIEPRTDELTTSHGTYSVFTQKVAEKKSQQ